MIVYPLTIGSVSIGQDLPFEGPDGNRAGLGDLGSKQRARVFEFPGGEISAQLYGSFPKRIEWDGILFGGDAFSRSFELQSLCDNGDFVTFTYGPRHYQGFVEEYKAHVKAFNIVEYSICFRPLQNNSTVSGGNLAGTDPFAGTVSNAQNTMTQQSTAPASGGTLPAGVQSGTSSLNNSINKALQQSGGQLQQIPVATLTSLVNQIAAIQTLLAPAVSGSDPVAASAAADLNSTLSVLSTAFNGSVNPLITTIQAINPNLFQLAARFYGDVTLYQLITDANGLPPDPLPVTNGVISLKIPVKPANAAA